MATELARRYRVDVRTGGTDASPTWVQLTGITDLTPTVSDATLQDASTYESDGWMTQEKTMQAWSLQATVLVQKDEDGTRNAALEAIRTSAILFGEDARVVTRWYDKNGGPEAYSGKALTQYVRANSGVADLDAATVTLTGDGPLIEIENPTVGTTPPVTP